MNQIKWQTNEALALDQETIIVATQDKASGNYQYYVVFYYEPMKVFYGGPGIEVKREDVKYWASAMDVSATLP